MPSEPHVGSGGLTPGAPDVPPPGGFKPVRYSRNLPKGGPSSLVIALGSAALFTFGMYKVISANRLRRSWFREEKDIRLAILPFLTAESDLQQQHIKSTLTQKEAELMASVPGWEAGASVYHSRYMKPMEKIGVPQSQKSIFGATS
ncbi:NADH-ubiquinone oxidoreductase alpha subcomplex, 13 [Emiliania huxleyi CCMP1516]|uniref:NADH dehydrogenase [ubiquinone] 1 alpha subcomplex subunit 13 n=2 Tax=Emiliania huxleyi TaxID=2903 RepID=A0A0D3JLY2_EMIH1|nr:hypothetical protein EMIHUDRAFT_100956 [Emiliania huxleyi CCMP1516]XP_005793551.1 NADH-ubiquinone oxidoreductase alpha subcomplex, 13 [Emiliania huxleyi CCMP1516]EOD24517.1 hypothetical protein EMIHUDRAFT_100956 [Emiliania huxleyi CCMP1516]EOD41122.1 NADH-ubiquinone oxidoreductase alpha subcomplex, 13 [Emiliania huxleyi CCMP1516]|eukprot:XP_005776946.1 hypothetical protein EMIHUDRAFT_100956 [Emiliania huxleyi CCMP1516]